MKTDASKAAETVAKGLLKIGAIKLSPQSPFRWASGWQSPIYCDNRLSLSFPEIRNSVKNALVEKVKLFFPDSEAVAGVATAGIPQGALLADALNLPFLYVRPKPKDHGLENLIEGKVVKGQKVIVIEDLISTGGSSLKAVEELRKSGLEVLGMVAIFTYGFKIAEDAFKAAEVKLVTISSYAELIDVAMKEKLIDPKDIDSLRIWRESPHNWRAI